MNRTLGWFGALLLASLTACERQSPSVAKPSAAIAAPATITPRVFRVAPVSGRAERVMVLLHGFGDHGENFLVVAQALAAALPDVEFLVVDGLHPYVEGPPGRQWFDIEGITLENRSARVAETGSQLSSWIDQELAHRQLSGDRLIVLGFSQGAVLSLWLGLNRVPSPTVVSLSGALAVEGATRGTPRVLIVHGTDDDLMPAALAPEAVEGLQSRGAKVESKLISGLGHDIDGRVLTEVKRFLQR